MTTITRAPARPVVAPELDFEARLALTAAEMGARLDHANVAYEVRTAHLVSADPIPEILAPPIVTPAVEPCPYTTPIAALLHRAHTRLERDGWCKGQLRDGARACLIGHIRTEASSRGQANDACILLLETIRRDFTDAETIPSWQDAQRDPRLPARYLQRAADLAHARTI